jgi:hypothetical protein
MALSGDDPEKCAAPEDIKPSDDDPGGVIK